MTGRCPKPARLKAFWKIDFRLAKKISSQPRYDHFDNSPSNQYIIAVISEKIKASYPVSVWPVPLLPPFFLTRHHNFPHDGETGSRNNP